MSFKEAVKVCVTKKYATFSGRARRSEFWWFALFQIGLPVLVFIIGSAFASSSSSVFAAIGGVLILVAGLAWLGLVIPGLAVTWRRLHDAGLAGPWFFISIVPFGTIALIVMCCLQTQAKKNKFGSVPA